RRIFTSRLSLSIRTVEWHYENGLREGLGREFYSDGTWKTTMKYNKGQLEGVLKEYYPSGILKKKAFYINGQRNEWVETYSEDGSISAQAHYKYDLIDGDVKLFFPKTGQVRLETIFKDDILNGLSREYYENGVIKRETTYVNNIKEGPEVEYYPDGTKSVERVYQEDKVVQIRRYNQKGELVFEQ
ncbi:MAG TPA: toxin-antitoxin system YwqK family antitoxin, partial [Candidatus Omnitrophota bacterium]|nr:toxin-antitoxin system YwqK family antitoxin [Candidatus Omnitrophota bacterium]